MRIVVLVLTVLLAPALSAAAQTSATLAGRVVDLAFSKTTSLGGSRRLEVRLEMFNLFNRANFGVPNLTVFAGAADGEAPLGSFGRIRNTVTSARQVQLGARLRF